MHRQEDGHTQKLLSTDWPGEAVELGWPEGWKDTAASWLEGGQAPGATLLPPGSETPLVHLPHRAASLSLG